MSIYKFKIIKILYICREILIKTVDYLKLNLLQNEGYAKWAQVACVCLCGNLRHPYCLWGTEASRADPNCAVTIDISPNELVQNHITIFPNPSYNNLFLINNSTFKNYNWHVISPLDFEILSRTSATLELQNFANSIYYLKLTFKIIHLPIN